MIIKLTHPFLWRCKDIDPLFDGCIKFGTFCSNLEKQAKKLFPTPRIETPEETEARLQKLNKYKGDCFELFVEAMFKLFPCDKRLGLIEDYQIVTRTDIGVDAYGISGSNGKPFTIQCKYRQFNASLEANKDHLTNFTNASMLGGQEGRYKVDQTPDPITHKCNMMVVTSGKSLAFFTDFEMFQQMVWSFCRKDIESLVDNNPTFWKYFQQSWEESLKALKA